MGRSHLPGDRNIGACWSSGAKPPTAAAQAIVEADDSESYPRMPNDAVLLGLLKRGLRKHHGHDMRSLKSWIRANR